MIQIIAYGTFRADGIDLLGQGKAIRGVFGEVVRVVGYAVDFLPWCKDVCSSALSYPLLK